MFHGELMVPVLLLVPVGETNQLAATAVWIVNGTITRRETNHLLGNIVINYYPTWKQQLKLCQNGHGYLPCGTGGAGKADSKQDSRFPKNAVLCPALPPPKISCSK